MYEPKQFSVLGKYCRNYSLESNSLESVSSNLHGGRTRDVDKWFCCESNQYIAWTARQLCDDLKGLQELLSTAFATKNFKTILIRAHVTKCCSLALYFLCPLLQWICWYYSWYTYPYMAIYICNFPSQELKPQKNNDHCCYSIYQVQEAIYSFWGVSLTLFG